MKHYPLRTESQHIDPFWLQRMQGKRPRVPVQADGRLMVEGEQVRFVAEGLLPGTEVEVCCGREFYAVKVAELEQAERGRRALMDAEKEARRQRLNALRERDEAFNRRIRLPVRWEVAIKDRVGSLLEGSRGDGRTRATVEHIRLLEPLVSGRLMRPKGAFLCAAAKGNYANQGPSTAYDGEGDAYQPAVSCTACLKAAARWIKE